MKVRHLKHYILFGLAYNNWPTWMEQRQHGKLQSKLATVPTPKAAEFHTEPTPAPMGFPATEHSVEVAKQEFVVLKKSTGEVVDTFDTRADAEALIEKHKKQKKAALVLLDTAEALA